MSVSFLLLILGVIFLFFAAFNVPSGGRVNWAYLGWACLAAGYVLPPLRP